MKKNIKIVFFFLYQLLIISAFAQVKTYSAENAHSHNDYLNPQPFYKAYQNGFGSIEADVFPVNGVLYVAHKKAEIQSKNTLQHLYINPLACEFVSDSPRKLSLLIDIKDNYDTTLLLLIKELEPLKKYLATLEHSNYLTIVVSGKRPPPPAYKNYPDFIFFDDDLKLKLTADEWQRVALVSLPFNKLSAWKGKVKFKHKDRCTIKNIIDSVHSAGKPIRFWAAPDTKLSWKWQMRLRVDLIGTDMINELGGFLRNENDH